MHHFQPSFTNSSAFFCAIDVLCDNNRDFFPYSALSLHPPKKLPSTQIHPHTTYPAQTDRQEGRRAGRLVKLVSIQSGNSLLKNLIFSLESVVHLKLLQTASFTDECRRRTFSTSLIPTRSIEELCKENFQGCLLFTPSWQHSPV